MDFDLQFRYFVNIQTAKHSTNRFATQHADETMSVTSTSTGTKRSKSEGYALKEIFPQNEERFKARNQSFIAIGGIPSEWRNNLFFTLSPYDPKGPCARDGKKNHGPFDFNWLQADKKIQMFHPGTSEHRKKFSKPPLLNEMSIMMIKGGVFSCKFENCGKCPPVPWCITVTMIGTNPPSCTVLGSDTFGVFLSSKDEQQFARRYYLLSDVDLKSRGIKRRSSTTSLSSNKMRKTESSTSINELVTTSTTTPLLHPLSPPLQPPLPLHYNYHSLLQPPLQPPLLQPPPLQPPLPVPLLPPQQPVPLLQIHQPVQEIVLDQQFEFTDDFNFDFDLSTPSSPSSSSSSPSSPSTGPLPENSLFDPFDLFFDPL